MHTGPYIIANWKSHKTFDEVTHFCHTLKNYIGDTQAANTIILGVPFIYLHFCHEFFLDIPCVHIAAQTSSSFPLGAYTGEVHASMLASLGIQRVIIGHSERREHMFEKQDRVREQLQAAAAAGLKSIYCCGEPTAGDKHVDFVRKQLRTELVPLLHQLDEKLIIAYEPRRAIGTGEIPSQEHIEYVLSCIKTSDHALAGVPLVYGGSVNVDNAAHLIQYEGINGFLVGGASLDAASLGEICKRSM